MSCARAPFHGQADSILQVSVINLISHTRHLMGFLRLGETCGCGCGGYCSINAMMQVLSFQLQCLIHGKVLDARHDGSPWGRDEKPKTRFGFRSAVIYLKGDWAEFAKSMGLNQWSNMH
eukprot:7056697-Pyramimonas_sp.AAC.2